MDSKFSNLIAFKGYFKEAIDGGINRLVVFPIHTGGGSFLHNCASASNFTLSTEKYVCLFLINVFYLDFYTCVKVLLENGIDVDIQDNEGKTAYDIAISYGK